MLFLSGWHWGNNIYKFIPLPWNGLSWTEAELYCKEMERGHLLSIRSQKESRWVTRRVRQIRRVLGFSKFWIGASDFGHQGVYEWIDKNSPVTYTRSDSNWVLANIVVLRNEETERVNERLNNERTKERASDWTNNSTDDRTSERTIKQRTSDWLTNQ